MRQLETLRPAHIINGSNGFKLSGTKQFVVQGASADMLIVVARTEEGLDRKSTRLNSSHT